MPRKTKKFTCQVCSRTFVSTNYNKIKTPNTCSNECRLLNIKNWTKPHGRKKTGKSIECKSCKKIIYQPDHYLKKNRGFYCSYACRNEGKSISKICINCKKIFFVPKSNQNRYNYCSLKCKKTQVIYVECKKCKKRFTNTSKNKKRYYCSRQCAFPHLKKKCKNCDSDFIFYGVGRTPNLFFCSISCYRRHCGETSIEEKTRKALEKNKIDFIQEKKIGRYSIDFYLPKYNLCLEVDGSYWHRDNTRDVKRDSFLSKKGFHVLRIGEIEINSVENLTNYIMTKINDFISNL